MTTLPKETQERINHDSKGWDAHRAYIAGATTEATRALPLLEALQKIGELSTSRDDKWKEVWMIAHQAINTYNKQ